MNVIPVNLAVKVDRVSTMTSVDRVQSMKSVDEVPVQISVVDANRLRRGAIRSPSQGTFWAFGNGQLILFGNGTSIKV